MPIRAIEYQTPDNSNLIPIRITDYHIPDYSHDRYAVDFYSDSIITTVTYDPQIVADWISSIESIHRNRLHRLIVGLDIEWRPTFNKHEPRNPVATLQLCVGRRCLIFQVYLSVSYGHEIPVELINFLGNQYYTFVGVGIEEDTHKMVIDYDYDLFVGGKIVDLRGLAAKAYRMDRLKNAGLKELTRVVLNREIEKPRSVTLGRWDSQWLDLDQVAYACLDAFVSFEIGKRLYASDAN